MHFSFIRQRRWSFVQERWRERSELSQGLKTNRPAEKGKLAGRWEYFGARYFSAPFLDQNPTGSFTILKPRHQEIGDLYVVQERNSADYEAQKLSKGRSGDVPFLTSGLQVFYLPLSCERKDFLRSHRPDKFIFFQRILQIKISPKWKIRSFRVLLKYNKGHISRV